MMGRGEGGRGRVVVRGAVRCGVDVVPYQSGEREEEEERGALYARHMRSLVLVLVLVLAGASVFVWSETVSQQILFLAPWYPSKRGTKKHPKGAKALRKVSVARHNQTRYLLMVATWRTREDLVMS